MAKSKKAAQKARSRFRTSRPRRTRRVNPRPDIKKGIIANFRV